MVIYCVGGTRVENHSIYSEIAERTQGDIYIGVVGPVRSGKSTFIKQFMDLMVLPNIENVYSKERAKDELPQSASGRTIMTTEPKFVPNEAATITFDGNVELKVRLVDCVGYLVNGALGYIENNAPRMVSTPWFEHQIPFEEAAEIGTKKVINEHSTIGLVMTTDGTVTEIPREDYVGAEEQVIRELKEINKPFVIILNSVDPSSVQAKGLREELEEKYSIPVICANCINLSMDDINNILEKVLHEFPIEEIGVNIPDWVDNLDDEFWLKKDMYGAIKNSFSKIKKITEVKSITSKFLEYDFIKGSYIEKINLGEGKVIVEINTKHELFYKIMSEMTGLDIDGDHKLIELMKDFSRIKKEYDKIQYALHEVKAKGYGIVMPSPDELTLEEPEIVKQGNRFGVKLRASAPSIHLIRADIETEISPLVGTERQSEELVSYLLQEFEGEPGKMWSSNIFGKSLHELVSEGLQNKLSKMPEDAQFKLRETLERIINEGSSGLICIIL
jgi:stage IV sporulation protein A